METRSQLSGRSECQTCPRSPPCGRWSRFVAQPQYGAVMNTRQVRLSDPSVAPLLAGLAAEYEARYGPSDEMGAAHEVEFDPPSGLFLAVVTDGIVIAGGGYRYFSPGVCEVKRMWTQAAHRRHGYASTLLRALEEAARAAGYTALRLETGPAQPEAAAMYTSHGYRRIPVYGRYPAALAFEKSLPVEPGTVGLTFSSR